MRLLLADRAGRPYASHYHALGRSGTSVVPLTDLIPMPSGAQLVQLPERSAVTRDRHGNSMELESSETPVGALLPIGFTRTLLPPAFGQPGDLPLPLFGYTAVAEQGGRLFVAAIHTDRAPEWNARKFNTPDLQRRIERKIASHAGNVLAEQLGRCSLEYGCFTAQNTFYERWEMALPTSVACNAQCIGCLSEQEAHSCPASQARITRRATADEIVALALPHLETSDRPMVSFGQGCEGEPLLNWRVIEAAIGRIRAATSRGWININTNGSDPNALARLIDVGLDTVRISTISARPETYAAYYRPRNYACSDVARSLRLTAERGIRTSVNLLVFPGLTDRKNELDALIELFGTTGLEQVQLRNLNIDPDQLMASIPPDDVSALGIAHAVERFREDLPGLAIGSVSRLPEREGNAPSRDYSFVRSGSRSRAMRLVGSDGSGV